MNTTPKTLTKVSITGTGSYLPEKILTNADLEKMVDTSDEWITTRTGISERHIAADNEVTSDMAAIAAKRAIEDAGITAADIDLIIVGTLSPDMPFPNTACFVQSKIGAENAACFDIEAACSGFLFSLQTARAYLTSGMFKTALVIGAEKLSSVTDWQDRGTCILFGDGAGAVVLTANTEKDSIIATHMGSDGNLTHLLNLPGGGSAHPASEQTLKDRMHYMKMTGNEVFKHAVRCMCDSGQKALDMAGLTIDDIDWVIPHQANMRIIKAIANRFNHCIDKFIINLDKVGNMSAASVPVALDEAVKAGKVKKGDKILSIVFGGGFTWGAMVIEF